MDKFRHFNKGKVGNVKKYVRGMMFSRKEGFSLLELIMVMVIMGIIAAIALPRLEVKAVDLYTVVRQVKADIRFAQESAMSKYRETTITFSSDSNTYNISSSGINESKELPVRSKAVFDSGNSTALTFVFNSSGEPVTGAGGILRISSGGSYEEIKVENITGRATIQ